MVFPLEALQLSRKPTKWCFSSGRFAFRFFLHSTYTFRFAHHFVTSVGTRNFCCRPHVQNGCKKKKIFFFYASQKSLAELPEWWIANSPFSVVLLQSRDTRIEYQIIQAHKPLRILGLFGPMYHLKVRDTNGSVPVLFCYW